MLYIDIDIGDEAGKKRITVYPGDDNLQLAQEFCIKYDIKDKSIEKILFDQLNEKIARVQKAKKDKES